MIKLNKNEQGFGVVEIIAIIVIILAVVLVSTIMVTKSSAGCNKQYETALAAAQPKISELNNLALLGEKPTQKANVQRSGDCVDSRPYVTVSKAYKVNEDGGKAIDTIRDSLKGASYKIISEDFGREGCKVHYKVLAEKNNIKVYAVAYQKDIKDSACTDGYPTGITEANFRSQKVDSAELTLKN